MFIKNDISGRQHYFNGKIGIVSSLNDKEIEVDVKFSGGKITQSIFNWGFTTPIKIKGGDKKKFDMTKPSTFLGTIQGSHGANFFNRSKATVYDYTMTIIITSEGVTENKEFKMRLYHHG